MRVFSAKMCDCDAPDLVTDFARGEMVCRMCGVVVEAHMFSEHMEHYSEAAGPRAGPPACWLLPDKPVVLDKMPHRRRIIANPDPLSSLRKLFDCIERMGHMFSKDVQDNAKLLCRDLSERRTIRSSVWHVYAAAALYLGTTMRGNGVGRSKKEIAAMFAPFGVTEHALTGVAKMFRTTLHDAAYVTKLTKGLDAGDLINRCVDRLDLDNRSRNAIKKAAQELVDRLPARELEGKMPGSVCSGVIACCLHTLGIKVTKRQVAECCSVSNATMDKMIKFVRCCVKA